MTRHPNYLRSLSRYYFVNYVRVRSATFSGTIIRGPTSNKFVSIGEHLLIRLSIRCRPMWSRDRDSGPSSCKGYMHITLYIIMLWLTKIQKQQECIMFYWLKRHRGRAGVTSLLSNPIHFSARFFFTKDQLNVLKLNISKHTDKKEHFVIQCTDKKGSIQCTNVKNINLFLFHSHSICHWLEADGFN